MTEKYFLNGDALPTVPTPHDCVIKKIEYDNDYLIFIFDDDISSYDSVKFIRPDAKSLIIRIHLIDSFDTYRWKLSGFLRGEGYYLIDNKKLISLTKKPTEYISHNIGYQSIMIKIFESEHYLLDIWADFIEFEWTEK